MHLEIPYSKTMDDMQPQLDSILESARDAIITIKQDGTIDACNKSAALTFGFEQFQLIGRNISEFIPNYDRVKTSLCPDTPFETQGIRNTGLDFPIELNATTLKSKELTSLIIRDITEKKISSNCYLQKTSEFQSLFEELHACFLRLDPNEIILDYHIGQISDFCAKTPPLLGDRLSDYFPESTATLFRKAFDIVKNSGKTQNFEYALQKQDHTSVFLVTIKPFLQEQMIAIIQDITDYKDAEKSILNYHTLADILPIGIFRCDMNGHYIYQNEFWLELTGEDEQKATYWLDSVHPDDQARVNATWKQITQEGVPFNSEFRFLTPKNEAIYIQCRAVPETDDTGTLRGYIGIANNITDNILTNSEIQKNWIALEAKIEERTTDLRAKNRWLQQTITERKQIELTLREERNFISTVIDTAAAIIMVCDANGHIVRLNQSLIALTGYTEREIQGKLFYDYLVREDEVEVTLRLFNELKSHRQRSDYEGVCKTKHGTEKLISWSNTVIINENNAIEYVVFTGIDITEQRQAEEEARQHQADLIHVSRLSTMGEMAAGLAHEINQPLAAIMNYTQGCIRVLNQTETANAPELTHALRQVSVQAERAGEIIRKLRELVNKGEPQQSKIKLEQIVRNAIKFASSDIKNRSATVRLRMKENLPEVNADPIQIEQVLLNLIRNGLEAMANTQAGERELVIRVFVNENNNLQVTVSDKGEGLPNNLGESKVFDAFFTTKANGMGMGLAISRSIIEAHGGQMWATRNTDLGSSFHFSLPIK